MFKLEFVYTETIPVAVPCVAAPHHSGVTACGVASPATLWGFSILILSFWRKRDFHFVNSAQSVMLISCGSYFEPLNAFNVEKDRNRNEGSDFVTQSS